MSADRIYIEYQLRFTTPFHCGTGIRESLVDRTVTRDNEGYLYVPGSTFKGVLRDCCEQLARFYEQDEQAKLRVHSPHNAKAALLELWNPRHTMVTRIFGSQNAPGQLFFDDARQLDEGIQEYDGPHTSESEPDISESDPDPSEIDWRGKYKNFQVNVYTQVRIDRPTHTAVPGALYTSEFGADGTVFQGTIQGWLKCTTIDPAGFEAVAQSNVTPTYSLLLLLAGLRMVDRLGGNKSTGKGRCECTITRIEFNGVEVESKVWESWLGQLDVLADYNRSQEG